MGPGHCRAEETDLLGASQGPQTCMEAAGPGAEVGREGRWRFHSSECCASGTSLPSNRSACNTASRCSCRWTPGLGLAVRAPVAPSDTGSRNCAETRQSGFLKQLKPKLPLPLPRPQTLQTRRAPPNPARPFPPRDSELRPGLAATSLTFERRNRAKG